jgi:hypothetical protein
LKHNTSKTHLLLLEGEVAESFFQGKANAHAWISTAFTEAGSGSVFATGPQFTIVWNTSEDIVAAARIDFWDFRGDHVGDTSDEVAGWGNGASDTGINGSQTGSHFSGVGQ